MKFLRTLAPIFLTVLIINCGSRQTISISNWTINVDPERGSMNVSHQKLNAILSDMHLNILNDSTVTELTGWSIDNTGNIVSITTGSPRQVTWEFILEENDISVRTSDATAYLSALAPAPKNRFPARVADPENMQAQNTGRENDYTGVDMVEKYYVPAQNPHVMYLALGNIEAANLFSLFDKDSNTVIQFSPGAEMIRWPENQSYMELKVPIGTEKRLVHLIGNYYTDVLGMPKYIPYNDSLHTTAPTGWNHWLAFFREVTEQDIVDHADFIAENLKQYGMEHCQLDDGYDHTDRRLWSKNWDPETFPHGPEWLAGYIKSKGLIPGLWTVPYCYSVNDADPDWFLRDDEGNILMDYQGGGELDFSRPEVIQEYWIPLWQEFKRQGWQYYKFDMGNTSWMWYHYQHNFYDTTKSSFDVSRETMTLFREIMGPEIWYTNHPDVYGGRMGFIDVAGCGRDPGPGWRRMNNFFEVISNNTYQNHIVWYTDPDCIVLRGKPTRADAINHNTEFLTFEEARTCASLLSLSGLQFLSGDDLINLEKDRLDLIKKTIPILPVYPVDLFGRSRYKEHYPEIFDLKINAASGTYDVVAVTNWHNQAISRKVLINSELSLPLDEYLVFDFWQEKLIGLVHHDFQTELPAHGTRVFTVHRKTDVPQFLATNRHITSALSVQSLTWNDAEKKLSGISQTVPGTKYTLFFYVPPDQTVNDIDTDAEDPEYDLDQNGLLTVSFTGQEKPVRWTLDFNKLIPATD